MVVTAHVDGGEHPDALHPMAPPNDCCRCGAIRTMAAVPVAVAVFPRLTRVLRLLVDTSTWLDLAKRRDGQKWIVAIRLLVHQGEIELLVPSVVVDEFERNRER